MARPLVSIVIATYNRAHLIAETIESVLGQTYSPIEVIVIDDGSTDDTKEVVRGFGERVEYVWQTNAERSAARNHGLRLAAGEFVGFLDSDDLYLPTKIEQEVAVLRKDPDCGFVYSDIHLIEEDGSLRRVVSRNGCSGRITNELLQTNLVSFSAHLARASTLREAGGFNEDISFSEDWEFWVRLSTFTKFCYLPVATAKMRQHSGNTVKDDERAVRGSIEICEKFAEASYLNDEQKQQLSKTRARVSLGNALRYARLGTRRRSAKYLLSAAQYDASIMSDPQFLYTAIKILGLRQISEVFYFLHRTVIRKP